MTLPEFPARAWRALDPGDAPHGEALVDCADIESLVDVANSYEIVRTIRPILVTRDTAVRLASATLALGRLLLTCRSRGC